MDMLDQSRKMLVLNIVPPQVNSLHISTQHYSLHHSDFSKSN